MTTTIRHRPLPKIEKPKARLGTLPFDRMMPGHPLIITCFSPAGGTSALALNIAALIASKGAAQAQAAERYGVSIRVPRVLAFDGDVGAGSLALLLNGEVRPSMHDLILYMDDRGDALGIKPLDKKWQVRHKERWPRVYAQDDVVAGEKAMQQFVHMSKIPNLDILAAPDDPSKSEDLAGAEFEELLDVCSQFYDVIVIDCGSEQQMTSNQTWLRHAHSVCMTVTPAVDRIWNASKSMSYIARRRRDPDDFSTTPRMLDPLVSRERVSVVMTDADIETGISFSGREMVSEFFPFVDESQRFFIPDVSQALIRAGNAHSFLALEDARYGRALLKIVKHSFDRYTL